jgi:hypothetical protein
MASGRPGCRPEMEGDVTDRQKIFGHGRKNNRTEETKAADVGSSSA